MFKSQGLLSQFHESPPVYFLQVGLHVDLVCVSQRSLRVRLDDGVTCLNIFQFEFHLVVWKRDLKLSLKYK